MTLKKRDYIATVGRRKSAIARVRLKLKPAETLSITVNDRDFKEYFNYAEWQNTITSPLTLVGELAREITVRVTGGGIKSQAEAVRLGVARALIELNPELRQSLKKVGFLSRDARIKERKKPGLKKARRAPQWSKR